MWSNHDSTWTYKYDQTKGIGIGDESTEVPWERGHNSNTDTDAGNTSSGTEFTQSYYAHDYEGKENEFKNLKYYDMIFTEGSSNDIGDIYWLSGRYVHLTGSACDFGLNCVHMKVEGSFVRGRSVFESDRRRVVSKTCTSSYCFYKSRV